MLTHTYPHKPLRDITVTICKLIAHFKCGLMSDLVVCKFRKSMVIHDTECHYWDQLLFKNTNQAYTACETHADPLARGQQFSSWASNFEKQSTRRVTIYFECISECILSSIIKKNPLNVVLALCKYSKRHRTVLLCKIYKTLCHWLNVVVFDGF